jgi:dipeptidyl aminopeptidase/acylaminoacyl peptidase
MTASLISRRILFGNPERTNYQISPDGAWITWVAPADGVLNVFIAARDDVAGHDAPLAARQLTFDTGQGIHRYAWTLDETHLVYAKDTDGDEDTHLFALRLSDGAVRDLTPFPGVKAMLAGASRRRRGEVAVLLNQRDARHHDVFTLDLASGAMTLAAENPGYLGIILDEDFVPRIAIALAEGGGIVLHRNTESANQTASVDWEPWLTIDQEDSRTTHPVGLNADGTILYLLDSRGRDTAALCAVTIRTGEVREIASDPRADISEILADPDTQEILAYGVDYQVRTFHVLDPRADDISWLVEQGLTGAAVVDRSENDRLWLVGTSSDTAPSKIYLFDRDTRRIAQLPSVQPALDGWSGYPMRSDLIPTRDGLTMVSYATLPRDAGPVPLVLVVHGGPEARDHFGFNPEHQWLADRGYAVLSVNFRGSTGFGKAFVNACEGEWGRAMDDDLCDAVAWAIANLPVDPARVAIYGGSYGGYATLVGLTRHPDLYACGVDIVGPSNLETLIETIPPYWEAQRAQVVRMIGDPATEAGRALLRERSPLHQAHAIRKPLLIAQGANDPRVKTAESEQMVAALKAHAIPVTYLFFPNEGHGFARPENRLSFYAQTEVFLSEHLGGCCEPEDPEIRARSSLQITR